MIFGFRCNFAGSFLLLPFCEFPLTRGAVADGLVQVQLLPWSSRPPGARGLTPSDSRLHYTSLPNSLKFGGMTGALLELAPVPLRKRGESTGSTRFLAKRVSVRPRTAGWERSREDSSEEERYILVWEQGEASSGEHSGGKVSHDRFGLEVEVSKHFVTPPPAEEADAVRIDIGTQQGGSASGSQGSSRNVMWEETVLWSKDCDRQSEKVCQVLGCNPTQVVGRRVKITRQRLRGRGGS